MSYVGQDLEQSKIVGDNELQQHKSNLFELQGLLPYLTWPDKKSFFRSSSNKNVYDTLKKYNSSLYAVRDACQGKYMDTIGKRTLDSCKKLPGNKGKTQKALQIYLEKHSNPEPKTKAGKKRVKTARDNITKMEKIEKIIDLINTEAEIYQKRLENIMNETNYIKEQSKAQIEQVKQQELTLSNSAIVAESGNQISVVSSEPEAQQETVPTESTQKAPDSALSNDSIVSEPEAQL